MRTSFPNKDQLSAMSVQQLRNLDVADAEEEALVQEILNLKLVNLPPENPIYRKDIPDIKTPEDEAKYQEIVDEREAKMKPQISQSENSVIEEVKIPGLMQPIVSLDMRQETEKRFCQYCDSKGFRHKKSCTRPAKK